MASLAKAAANQLQLNFVDSGDDVGSIAFPERVTEYPELRYMGSKHRLLP
jgi:hypothetical protein